VNHFSWLDPVSAGVDTAWQIEDRSVSGQVLSCFSPLAPGGKVGEKIVRFEPFQLVLGGRLI